MNRQTRRVEAMCNLEMSKLAMDRLFVYYKCIVKDCHDQIS
jgi:hypothetical protein